MAGEGKPLHEAPEDLSSDARELHRAIVSLIEELEAIDWYQQRVEASGDAELKAVLGHNRDEEIEHACMTLEWIRRRSDTFDRNLRRILFRKGPIVQEDDEADEPGERTLGIGRLHIEGVS
jgi:hypothetical protein